MPGSRKRYTQRFFQIRLPKDCRRPDSIIACSFAMPSATRFLVFVHGFILSFFARKGRHCFRFGPSIFSVWWRLNQIFHL